MSVFICVCVSVFGCVCFLEEAGIGMIDSHRSF